MAPKNVTIGILALQGAFAEHQAMFQKVSPKKSITTILVRTPEELAKCDGLVIPGGESTTIALLARLGGLLEPLREFLRAKPVWGTCAGAILLSGAVENTKKGGQELLGGVSVTTARNGFGPQVESFEAALQVEGLRDAHEPFVGIFIRAPVILSLTPAPTDPPIRILARLTPELLPKNRAIYTSSISTTFTTTTTSSNSSSSSSPSSNSTPDFSPPHNTTATASTTAATTDFSPAHNTTTDDDKNNPEPQTIVALRQGPHLLTTFHPELTHDARFHEYFVRECVWPSLSSLSS